MSISKDDYLKGLQRAKDYTDKKVGEIPEPVQSNWDETAQENPSFIQNKPFGYVEQICEESYFELPYVIYPSNSTYLYDNRNIALNIRGYINCHVTNNHVTKYKRYGLNFSNIIFDNIYEMDFGDVYGGDELKLTIQRNNTQHSISITISQNPSFNGTINSGGDMDIVLSYNKKIESQYIDVPNSDWNEEDESQLSFIKNTQEPKAKLSALDEFFDLEKTRAIMIDMGFIEGGDEDEI